MGIKNESCLEYYNRRLSEGWKEVFRNGDTAYLCPPDGSALRAINLLHDVETLRPNASGDETNIETQYPDTGSHYDKVDEETADDNSTYVRISSGESRWERDLYNLYNSSSSGTINSITVYARVLTDNQTFNKYKIAIKSGTTVSESDEIYNTQGYTYETSSETWTTNPATSSAWTWSEIDSLQAGVNLYFHSTRVNYIIRCTQIYVEVNYTPANKPTVTTSAVSNITHNSAQANGNITNAGIPDPDERGFVYGTTSKSDPGDTAPTSSGYDSYKNETGTYSTGTYNLSLTSLTENQTYYVRAYAHNSAGYAYGDEVTFQTYRAPINYNESCSTNLSLSSSVTFTKGKGVAITTGLGLCVNDRNNYLFTIPSDITKDVVDFPFVITENNIPSSFWSIAETDNLILRDVTGSLLYGELVTLDTVNHKLELYAKIPYAFEGISRSFILSVGEGASLVGLTGTANAQSVWSNDFVFVSHMNDQEGGTKIYDSTSNANHGTKGAGDAAPTEVDGLVGKAQSFDGIDDLINIPSLLLKQEDGFTVETYSAYHTLPAGTYYGYMFSGSNRYNSFIAVSYSAGSTVFRDSAGNFIFSHGSLSINDYHYRAVSCNSVLNSLYHDGDIVATNTHTINNTNVRTFSRSYSESAYGLLHQTSCETRISSTARGPGWISFTSSNLKENSTSYSVTETSQTSPSRQVNYSRDSLANLSLTSIVTRTVNYAVRMAITNLSLNPIVTRTVNYTRSATTNLSFQSVVTAIKRGWIKVKLKLFNRSVKVKLPKRDIKLKIRRK